MKIKEELKWGETLLVGSEVEGSKASANFLMRRVLNCDKAYLIAHDSRELTRKEEKLFIAWIERRAKHEPVWYITSTIEFGSLILAVNEHVLIPRPETELLIERVVQELRNEDKELRILDVGTGSGTIILSLAEKFGKKHRYFASDVSHDALEVAKQNAKSNGLGGLIEFREGDLFSPWVGETFDVIVANLPYIPHEDMATLAFDLVHFEPRVALDGGAKGMEIYERFLPELPNYLNAGGMVFLEIGYNQGLLITKVVQKYMPKADVGVLNDYANIDRIVVIRA